jgi:hypothetical protein
MLVEKMELYMAEGAWDETTYELNKRIEKLVQRNLF